MRPVGGPKRGLLAVILSLGMAGPVVSLAQQQGTAPARPVLALSLEEAVRRALVNNADLAVKMFGPRDRELELKRASAAYEPLLALSYLRNSTTSPAGDALAGAGTLSVDNRAFNFSLAKSLRTGGSLRVDFDDGQLETNSVFSRFNPAYSSSFKAALVQPLLKDLRIDAPRNQIRVARKSRDVSEAEFRQAVAETVASVKKAYYDLIYAIDNLDAQRRSLALATVLLEQNRIRARTGVLSGLAVTATEAEQASREEAVIKAEAAVRDAEDVLKAAIFPEDDPAMWELQILPKDRPKAEQTSLDVEAAVRSALASRPDLVAARRSLEIAEYSLDFARNQRLPQLDVLASYGTSGLAGTLLERNGLGGPVVRTLPSGRDEALKDVFARVFPSWSLAVNFTYPIGSQARIAAARAEVSRAEAQANLRRLQLRVAAEVRAAARAVETNFKRIESTRAARVLQERQLDAETKRFALGMSTHFLVSQYQRDLTQAEVAELRAIADYNKSLADFERVQGTSALTRAR